MKVTKRINHETQGTMHHRFPRRMGGGNSPENLLLLCLKCHRNVHRDEQYAAYKGWMAFVDPASTPVWLHRTRWVTLTPRGTYVPLRERAAQAVLADIEASWQSIRESGLTPAT